MPEQTQPIHQPDDARRLYIQAWPLSSVYNTYTGTLNATMATQARVTAFRTDWRAVIEAFRRPADVIHIHWLERPFWSGARGTAMKQAMLALAITATMRSRGAKIVWTAHDPAPHAMASNAYLHRGWTGWLWRLYRAAMFRMMDGVLLLSESHRAIVDAAFPRLARVPKAVTPHPHFRGHYPESGAGLRAERRRSLGISADATVLGFIGNLRSYKNPDGLIEAFLQSDLDAVLLVAGKPESEEMEQRLAARAKRDARIRLQPGFIGDDDMAAWLRACDACVFPYREVTNSGSALLALSYDLPVIVPDEPVFRELQAIAGSEWVLTYKGEFTPESLNGAARWIGQGRGEHPDLSSLDWEPIAARTLAFFRSLRPRAMALADGRV